MINWGLIGAGNMGRIFAESIKEVDNANLVAVASLNTERVNSFGDDFKIQKKLRFNNYESICQINELDAIYISTLNNTHFDLIKMCAKNQKNILCEKPFCLNLSEALQIEKIINDNNVKFFEAIAYLSHPQTDLMLDMINNGEIGEINSIESSFGFKIKKIKPELRLFNKKLGGGAILDIGCYPISFISLFTKDKNKIKLKNIKGEICETNVDIDASADLLVNDKIKCSIKVSLKEYLNNNSIIHGSKASIIINSPWLPDKKTFLEISNKEGYYKKFIETDLSVYANQIKNVSNEFLNKVNKAQNLFDISKSVQNMKYLDDWMKNIN